MPPVQLAKVESQTPATILGTAAVVIKCIMSMEWVRCNRCGYYPSSLTRISIFLTNCGHLVCSKCLERAPTIDEPECVQCRKPCKTVKLGPDSRPGPEITFYFGDQLSAVKKLQQAVEFQKMHYDLGTEMVKRERLLREITEAERRIKEMEELGQKIAEQEAPLSTILQALRKKAEMAGIQLPSPAQQQHSNNVPQQTQMRSRRQGSSSFSASGATNSTRPLNRSSAQHGSVGSPVSTPVMSKRAMSGDPRVAANLMTQSQLQNWSQSHAQQRHHQQSPGVGMTTPTHTVGPHHNTVHGQRHNSRPTHGVQQHNMHPLNSVHSMHTTTAASAISTGGVSADMGARKSLVPGSSLSQAAEL